MSATERTKLMKLGQMSPASISHDRLSIILLLLAFTTYIVTVVFNSLAGTGLLIPQVFKSTVGNMSDKYETFVTPAGFVFSIWSVIYIWLTLLFIILITTIFLNNSDGRMYLSPPFATPLLSLTMLINFCLNFAWIFIWDREFMIAAAIVLILLTISGIAVTAMMARNINLYSEQYAKGTQMYKWRIVYRFLMNGFGLYTTWSFIASLVNLTVALVYTGQTDMRATCLATLSLLVIFHVTWFILENTVLDKYVRFLLTPYIVVIWASNGIRAKLAGKTNVPQEIKSYVLAILIIASITLVVRVAIVLLRTLCRRKTTSMASTVTPFNAHT